MRDHGAQIGLQEPVTQATSLDLTFQTNDGPVQALSDVSLGINKSAIIGRSSNNRTTLQPIAAALTRPTKRLMQAIAALGLLFPMAAQGFGCPATDTAPHWQMAACELASNSAHLADQAARQLQSWGPDAGPDLLYVAAFWSFQEDSKITIVEWGDYMPTLGRALLEQVETHGGAPLSDADRSAFAVTIEQIELEDRAQQDLVLDAIIPILAARGLAPLVLHMNSIDFGISIVPDAYACRWDQVALGPDFGWRLWTGSDTFDMYPETSTWLGGPSQCVVAVS